jgi:hypothetical protein
MQKLLISFLFLATMQLILAQSGGKDVVCLGQFSYSNSIGSSYVEGLRNEILKNISTMDRFILKDIQTDQGRKSINQTDDASTVDESTLVKVKDLSSKYLITGHVTVLKADKVTSSDRKLTAYNATLVYSLKVVDISTGETKGESYNYSASGFSSILSYGVGDTEAAAITSVFASTEGDIKKFINKHFPILGTVLEIAEEKKGEATKVYISLGSSRGIQKGQSFEVFISREIAGRASQKKIGELKATEVEGEELTLCKVGKGGKEIKAAIGDGQEIIVKTVLGGGILGGLLN